MDGKLFFAVLVASISFVVGPNPTQFTQTDLRNLLMDVRESMDRKDKDSPKQVLRVMQGRPALWFSLVTKCHYVLKHNSGSPDHLQACEYLMEHDCQVTLEVARASSDFDNDKKIEKWIEMVKKLYQFGNGSIEDDPRSEEITLCLPRFNQVEKRASSSQSQKRSSREDQQEFNRISLFIIDNSNVDPSYAEKLEAIAKIARKYEEKVLSELVNRSGRKLKKLLPDVEHACLNVDEVPSPDPEEVYQTVVSMGAIKSMEICRQEASAILPGLKRAYRKSTEQEIAAKLDQMSPVLFNFENLLPMMKEFCRRWSCEEDLPALEIALQTREKEEVMADLSKLCRQEMIRELLPASKRPHQTVKSKEVTRHAEKSSNLVEATANMRYMCNIMKRRYQQNWS